MKRFEFPVPRAPFAVAAAAMSVLTFALTVVVPTQLASVGQEGGLPAGRDIVRLAPIEVSTRPARLDTAGDCPREAVVQRDDLVGLKKSAQRV